jgi:hypothetical protein
MEQNGQYSYYLSTVVPFGRTIHHRAIEITEVVMLHHFYSNLVAEPIAPVKTTGIAEEVVSTYRIFTEKHLQVLWFEQKYFYPLTLDDGTPVTVLSPGIWNTEAGPDFLKAHLKIGDREVRGDIELHLSEEGWIQHKHHMDPAYNQVILHVCYWRPLNARKLATAENREVQTLYLESFLSASEAHLSKLIDIDLYPYKRFSGSGKCSQTLFKHLSEKETVKFFRSAAAWRLLQKKQYLDSKMVCGDDALKVGMALALGYKRNSEAFLQLFHLLNQSDLKEESSLLAKALSLCGFFTPYYQEKWGASPYYRELSEKGHQTDKTIALHLANIRPANHPVRRLAVLSKLVCSPKMTPLLKEMLSFWKAGWREEELGWHRMRKGLLAFLPDYTDPYWEHHYTFEEKEQEKPVALVGENLQLELLVNVCLPLIYGDIMKVDEKEVLAFQRFYASIPAAETKKAKYLTHRFFGGHAYEENSPILNQADLQQGAYQLHRDFCVHFEASCEGCTFVQRYNKQFNQQILG